MYTPNVSMIAAVAGAGLLWVGAQGGLASWEISLGTLTAFDLLLQRAFAPLAALGEQWQVVQGALAGVERVFTVLAVPSDQTGPERSDIRTSPSPNRSSVQASPAGELVDVVFGYVPGQPVLHHVSMAIEAGEHVALVGRTGAGKSSALSLLGGLYEPWEGRVRVLGRNPRDLAPSARRRLFGVVPQTALLFNGTVVENVSLFDPAVSREMVEQAVGLAGADAFIAALPHGYDTLLAGVGGGRGVRLSAGQTALMALARALVLDPPLILLDEATAAIDAATEAALATALRAGVVGRQRGLLTVAHRLATAREADRVIVLEGGTIVEEGAPSNLIRQGGRFAALVELEAAGWDWRDAPPAT
jgi:ATP-binding cassette subfamily B protein